MNVGRVFQIASAPTFPRTRNAPSPDFGNEIPPRRLIDPRKTRKRGAKDPPARYAVPVKALVLAQLEAFRARVWFIITAGAGRPPRQQCDDPDCPQRPLEGRAVSCKLKVVSVN